MTTLTGYVVDGALLDRGTGPEAMVSDQVKLYLDQDVDDGLPEFIVGTIQAPIVKVNCGQSTSYRIEYDEADLLGVMDSITPDMIVSAELVSAVDIIAAAVADLDAEWVAHGHSQSLTTGQKEQVSANIATSSGHTSPSQILSTDGSGRTRARQFIALASTFNGSITVLDTGIVAFVGASASFSTTLSFEEAASSDRSVVIPDAEGTLPPLPAYSSLSAANAAEAAIGIVFWNTTSGKAQVTTATS